MSEGPAESRIRLAAVEHLKRIASGGVVTGNDLRAGFYVDGVRIPLINPQRGIFKPASMHHLLSVRTVFPRTGARVWYDDQRTVHAQIERGDELVDYAFMCDDPQTRLIDILARIADHKVAASTNYSPGPTLNAVERGAAHAPLPHGVGRTLTNKRTRCSRAIFSSQALPRAN